MGAANKLLLPFGNSTVLDTVIERVRAVLPRIVLVYGYDFEVMLQRYEKRGCRIGYGLSHVTRDNYFEIVVNPDFDSGLASSIVAGVSKVPEGDAVMIVHGDMPQVQMDVIRDLYLRASPEAIVAPVYEDEPERLGHPVVFGPAYRAELLDLRGDVGARAVIDCHRDKLVTVPAVGALRDIDTAVDYLAAQGDL